MGFYRVTGNNYFDTYQSQSVEKAGLDAPSLSQHSFTFILEQGINVIWKINFSQNDFSFSFIVVSLNVSLIKFIPSFSIVFKILSIWKPDLEKLVEIFTHQDWDSLVSNTVLYRHNEPSVLNENYEKWIYIYIFFFINF